ncbi:MAG: hypothetical protein M1820_001529 [Bogoriella megaspora]|nr:MAG: hypothetical protein M1820_001529 [Bogoriella megaspora]
MKSFSPLSLAALASCVNASVLYRRVSGLELTLASESNTVVKATLKNTGTEALNLLNKGTFLDSEHVQKVDVLSSNSPVAFEGIRYRVQTTDLAEDAFTALDAGETKEVTFDLASVYDLSSGGVFDVIASGAIPIAKAGSTELTGDALEYNSNSLSVNVDAAEAATVARPYSKENINKRSAVQSDCTGTRGTSTRSALTDCVSLASAAARAAASGSAAKFQEYFKTTSATTRTTVTNRLNAVARECGSATSGATRYYCSDVYGACSSNVLAYTLPSNNVVVNCPLYFSALPHLTRTCHAQDQVTTTLHEFTHAPGVYSPGTLDNGYGYNAATSLSANAALNNADTYALYANAIYVGC